ncbi:MAG: hypothetical protein U1E85_05180 [Rhodocyclaceae bacterium]
MGARTGSLSLLLASGQVQRVLVEAGSMLVVGKGTLRVCFPFATLAERLVAVEAPLAAEEACCLEAGGWIELLALEAAEVLILSPENTSLWRRLGRYLERSLARAGGKGVSSSYLGPTA